MNVYVNRFKRFENTQSHGYDFLIPDNDIWDGRVKQWINMFISEGKQRHVRFLTPINNNCESNFISLGTITPDTEGKYDRDGRLNYCVDIALIGSLPHPPFALDVQMSSNCISAYLDKCESNTFATRYEYASLLAKKLASPPLLKLHNSSGKAEEYLHTVADYYLSKGKKLVIVLNDDSNYDELSFAVCNAIFENAPLTKSVYYITYTDNIDRLCNNSKCNLFCVPSTERKNIPQDKSVLVIDLVEGTSTRATNMTLMKDIIKCGLISDFNTFVNDHRYDPTIEKLLKLNCINSVTSLVYLYINYRELSKLRPDAVSETIIMKYISEPPKAK